MPQVAAAAVIAGLASGITATAAGITFALSSFLLAAGGSLLMSGAQMLLSSGAKKGKTSSAATSASSTQNVRQAITTHNIVYGQRRVGGPIVYMGSSQDNLYLHMIVVVACHEVEEIGEIWFNDECIPHDFIDSNGNVTAGKYENYARIRTHLGSPSQAADSFLVSEVEEWTNNHRLQGRAYLYVRLKFSQDVFASGIPTVTAVIKGKKVLDPRDGNIKYTANAALIARDYLADISYGFEASSNIDDDSVIAAANICDEIADVQPESLTVTNVLDTAPDTLELDCDILPFALGDRVDLSTTGTLPAGLATSTDYYVIPYHFQTAGTVKPRISLATSLANAEAGTYIDITNTGSGVHTVRKTGEPRFQSAAYLDTANELGSNMIELLSGFGGRLVHAGGSWRMVSPAYQTPTLEIDENDIIAPLQIQTKISRAERFNQIKGVYTSHLNRWQGADYPSVSDAAAITRDGQTLPRDYDLPVTFRPYTAQRLAKIELKKAVQEITVKAVCNLKALQCQCGDNIILTNTRMGWDQKPFEVVGFRLTVGGSENPELGVELTLRETAQDIYDWSSSEESTIDAAPNTSLPDAFTVQAVTGLGFDSVPIITRDGDEVYDIKISWNVHPDAFVNFGGQYEVQYKKTSDTLYQPSFFVDGELVSSTISSGSVGVSYDIRIRAINNIGVRSNWQTISGAVTGTSGITTTEDWGGVADAVATTEDWFGVADAVATTEDWGNV